MSSTFSPINLDKDLTKRGIKTVVMALLNAPVAMLLGVLLLGASHAVHEIYMGLDKAILGPAGKVAFTVFFIFLQIYLPALFSSFAMYKYTYQQTCVSFLQNMKSVGFLRVMMADLLLFMIIFTIMKSILWGLSSGASSSEAVAEIEKAEAVLSVFALLLVVAIALHVWLTMSIDRGISLRTGLGMTDSGRYRVSAQKMNPRIMRITLVILLLVYAIAVVWASNPIFSGMILGIVQILISMFWIYILFGNTFPTKETVKVATSRPASVTNV